MPTAPVLPSFALAFAVPAGVAGTPADHAAWSAAVATVAAWPATEPVQPLLERRFVRTASRGSLREQVVARLSDPLGLLAADDARRDAAELLRSLRRIRALRAVRRAAAELSLTHVAELGDLDPLIPEGRQALPGLFADLCSGLESLPGPVLLSLTVAPAPVEAVDEPSGEDVPVRRVRFRLRLGAAVPLPATLRARAEALCLSRRATAEAWSVGTGGDNAASLSLPGVAALLLALPAPASAHSRGRRTIEGRPSSGPLPSTGAALGRVRRLDGRAAQWRLPWEERRHHVFVAGASGCGKSTALLRLVLDDLAAGRMVVAVDPHGDLVAEIARFAGDDRVIRVDPSLTGTAPLDLLDADPRRAASHLMAAVTEVWPADYAGPVWQRGISLALRVLGESRNRPTTLADLERFLVDSRWRSSMIGALPDGRLRREAAHEAAAWATGPANDSSVVTWLAGKLTPLTQGPAAPLFGRPAPRALEAELDFRRALLVSLPLGELGSETVRLAGRMLLTRLITALAAQGAFPEAARRPVSVVVDEAHLVAGRALAGLFAQARKFGASVTVATQAPSQLGPHLPGVLTNAQTLLLGRLSALEARALEERAGPEAVKTLPSLPRHHLVAVAEDHLPGLPPLVLSPIPVPRRAAGG